MPEETAKTLQILIEHLDLGQIGYTAYRAKTGGVSLATGQKIPEWDVLPEAIKEAWLAAGKAIHVTVAMRINDLLAELNAAR